jgi:hypothetical protein
LYGAIPGIIGFLLIWLFAGCADGAGAPGMVCYDIKQFLFRIAGVTTVIGCVAGALFGLWLTSRRSSEFRG